MTTRRDFLKNTMLLSAGLTVGGVNLNAAGQKRVSGANRRINLACVGIGNRGGEILNEFDKTGLANIVALCDVRTWGYCFFRKNQLEGISLDK
jgi:hypothetical protein